MCTIFGTTPAEAEGEVGIPLNQIAPPVIIKVTDHSKVAILIWFSVLLVLVSVSMLFSPSI